LTSATRRYLLSRFWTVADIFQPFVNGLSRQPLKMLSGFRKVERLIVSGGVTRNAWSGLDPGLTMRAALFQLAPSEAPRPRVPTSNCRLTV